MSLLLLLGQGGSAGSSVNLIVTAAAHAHVADVPALTANSILVIDATTHAHAADAVALAVQSALAIDEAAHGHAADELALTADGATDLLIDAAWHGHVASAVVLGAAAPLAGFITGGNQPMPKRWDIEADEALLLAGCL